MIFLAASLGVFLFAVYPKSVAISVLVVGGLTAAACAIPLLPIVFPGDLKEGSS